MIYPADSAFHIHSYRCGHAQAVPDEAYIRKAIEIGARSICFSDHTPFPGDPFGNRMRMSELEEYLATLLQLKEEYAGQIEVHIGLETEYFPSYDLNGYYDNLRNDGRIEFLMLGQHMAETGPNAYSFSWGKERLIIEEYEELGAATVKGIKSGYFDYVAHPDRIFRRRKAWDERMQQIALEIISVATNAHIPIELNMHSVNCKYHYWKQFWALANDDTEVILGLDAHSVNDMEKRYRRSLKWEKALLGGNS